MSAYLGLQSLQAILLFKLLICQLYMLKLPFPGSEYKLVGSIPGTIVLLLKKKTIPLYFLKHLTYSSFYSNSLRHFIASQK